MLATLLDSLDFFFKLGELSPFFDAVPFRQNLELQLKNVLLL
jgi:hypothetical protein